jgi:hypothetical protein
MTSKDLRFNALILVPIYGATFAGIVRGIYTVFIQMSKVILFLNA